MEQAKRVTLNDGTEIDADPNRSYNGFLRIVKGPVTVRLSLTDAGALYELLHAYYANAEVSA